MTNIPFYFSGSRSTIVERILRYKGGEKIAREISEAEWDNIPAILQAAGFSVVFPPEEAYGGPED